MGIVLKEDDNITQHARTFASDGFWPSVYFLFPKSKEHLSATRFSTDSDVETSADNWLHGQGRDFYQAALNKLFLRSDKFLNRFGDHVEK
ncbi:hypothetical protein AVEN_197658-1 [Araneus ventricosus]|uniref:Uncharacterized protein n=1 Tax=Araneus ventricosus TaxID=182803 RepID=A0A4Y2REI5_ARAVE|nr:hypothetical protein AVEN_197658-1 [Araneus ventricosus]